MLTKKRESERNYPARPVVLDVVPTPNLRRRQLRCRSAHGRLDHVVILRPRLKPPPPPGWRIITDCYIIIYIYLYLCSPRHRVEKMRQLKKRGSMR